MSSSCETQETQCSSPIEIRTFLTGVVLRLRRVGVDLAGDGCACFSSLLMASVLTCSRGDDLRVPTMTSALMLQMGF